jgi:hypothetical protein
VPTGVQRADDDDNRLAGGRSSSALEPAGIVDTPLDL